MMDVVYGALKEVDIVVHLVDASEKYGKGEEFALDMVNAFEGPVLLALNKIDLIGKGRLLPMIDSYNQLGKYRAIIPISAATGDGVEILVQEIAGLLPEREFLFPIDQFTDQLERTLVAEIIREKLLEHTRQELPYSTAVKIEEFDETQREEGFVRITALIVVERSGQKKIVVGRGGQMIKSIGIAARSEIQALLDVPKIYLELNVKVMPGWRDRDHLLTELGIG
jgi:GTP-binding protein Era